MVADRQALDALAHLLDHAGALVAEDDRVRAERVPFCTDRSEWHTPEAPIFTLTSPALGASRSRAPRSRAARSRLSHTAAFGMWSPPGVGIDGLSGILLGT